MVFVFAFVPRLCSAQATAQSTIVLDTIYANDTKNVALFFPEPIRQGITGSDNFVFTYNREKEQYFGLLQAKPGKESNLLVVNRNGSIFSYIVRYKKQLSKLNYFIPLFDSTYALFSIEKIRAEFLVMICSVVYPFFRRFSKN